MGSPVERYEWRPNNELTRMHAVDVVKWRHRLSLGDIPVPSLCGWVVDTGIRWSGAAPPQCKRCERKVG